MEKQKHNLKSFISNLFSYKEEKDYEFTLNEVSNELKDTAKSIRRRKSKAFGKY